MKEMRLISALFRRMAWLTPLLLLMAVFSGGLEIKAQQAEVKGPQKKELQKPAVAESRQQPALVLASVANEPNQPATPTASERERLLMERIEQLERRLNEMESRLAKIAAPEAKQADPAAQPAASSQEDAVSLLSTNTAAPAPAHPQPQQDDVGAWEKAGVRIIPFGILVANANFNSSALASGSIGFFAFPDLDVLNNEQFNISPGNTYLGIDIKGPRIGDWAINGKVDFDLRGTTHVFSNNVFEPFFANVYGEARTERHRILVGQTRDVISPLLPRTLNFFPLNFLSGSIGYVRPQVRYEYNQPASEGFAFSFQAAVAQAIQTLQVSGEVIGRQTGFPDGQLRFAIGHGNPEPHDPFQKKPFELGISGHIGERRGTLLAIPVRERDFTTWSGNIDLTARLGSKARVEGEFFVGAVLGDYAGGVLQIFNANRGVAIRAIGGWAQLQYQINRKWSVTGGYGIDDPYNTDLSLGLRSSNDVLFGNFFYSITSRLNFAMEFSRWRTRWVGLPTGKAFRVEPALFFIF